MKTRGGRRAKRIDSCDCVDDGIRLGDAAAAARSWEGEGAGDGGRGEDRVVRQGRGVSAVPVAGAHRASLSSESQGGIEVRSRADRDAAVPRSGAVRAEAA